MEGASTASRAMNLLNISRMDHLLFPPPSCNRLGYNQTLFSIYLGITCSWCVTRFAGLPAGGDLSVCIVNRRSAQSHRRSLVIWWANAVRISISLSWLIDKKIEMGRKKTLIQ